MDGGIEKIGSFEVGKVAGPGEGAEIWVRIGTMNFVTIQDPANRSSWIQPFVNVPEEI